jgi:uncharacterized membrane protein
MDAAGVAFWVPILILILMPVITSHKFAMNRNKLANVCLVQLNILRATQKQKLSPSVRHPLMFVTHGWRFDPEVG